MGVNLNVAVALSSLARMVSVKLETVSKSVPAVAVPLSTDTATRVSLLRVAPLSVPVTVTVVSPAPSETLIGSSESVTLVDAAGVEGPSRMVTSMVDGSPTTKPSGRFVSSNPISTLSPGSTTSSAEAEKPKPT